MIVHWSSEAISIGSECKKHQSGDKILEKKAEAEQQRYCVQPSAKHKHHTFAVPAGIALGVSNGVHLLLHRLMDVVEGVQMWQMQVEL